VSKRRSIGATLVLNQGKFFTGIRDAKTGTNQLRDATTDATGSLRKMGREGNSAGGLLTRAGGRIGSAFKAVGVAAAAGTAAAVAGLGAMIVRTSNAANEIDQMAIRTGLSRQALQELQFAANQTGAKFEGVQTAVMYTNRNMMAAATSGGAQAAYFQRLGVAVTDASGNLRQSEEVLYDLIDALSQIPNEAERNAIGMRVMGRGFSYLAPLVAEGSEGIRAYAEQAHRMGVVMSDEAIAANVQFRNSMSLIRQSLGGVTAQIATQALPIVNGFLNRVIDNLPRLQQGLRTVFGFLEKPLGWLMNTALPALGRILVSVKEFGVRAFNNIREALERNQPTFYAIKDVAISVGEKLKNAFEFVRPALDWLIDTALPFLVDVLANVLLGATRVYDFFVNNWNLIGPVVAGITGAILAYKAAVIGVNVVEGIRKGITVLMTAKQWLLNIAMNANPIGIIILAIGALIAIGVLLWQNWDAIVEWITNAWKWLRNAVVNIGNRIRDFFVNLWESIKEKISNVWNGIKDFFIQWWPLIFAVFTGGISLIVGFVVNNWDAIRDTTVRVFNTIKDTVINIWQGIWNGIRGIINLILGGINGMIRGFVNGINGLINGVNRVTGAIGIPAIPSFTAPQIPLLAQGGIIQKAGRVIVGDAGPEFLDLPKGAKVTPLDKARNEDYGVFAGIKNAAVDAFNAFSVKPVSISELMNPIIGGIMKCIDALVPSVAVSVPIFEIPKPGQDAISYQRAPTLDDKRIDFPKLPKESKPLKDKGKTENNFDIKIYADGKSADQIVDELMPKLKLALANL